MPQMAPLMWMTLFFMFILIFMIFNILSYFNFLKFNKLLQNEKNAPMYNQPHLIWKW